MAKGYGKLIILVASVLFLISAVPAKAVVPASLTVNVTSVGGVGFFNFLIAQDGRFPGASFAIETVAEGAPASFAFPSISPGNYVIIETGPPGWDVTGSPCTVTIGEGGSATCNIANTITSRPVITRINPERMQAGSEGFSLSVVGNNFRGDSIVRINGEDRATMGPFSGNELRAEILTTDIAAVGILNVTVFNPAPDGGTSNTAILIIENPPLPTPTITSISPTYASVGSGPTTVTINGTGFVAGSTEVKIIRPGFLLISAETTVTSPTQLQALIPASYLEATGIVNIYISNPFTTSDFAQLAVIDLSQPTITTIDPTSKEQGSPGFTLTVEGSNFTSTSIVTFNGDSRPTTFVSPTRLTAQIPASDLTSMGSFSIVVETPLFDGVTAVSNAVSFRVSVSPTITSINPTSVRAGSGNTTITIRGTNFLPTTSPERRTYAYFIREGDFPFSMRTTFISTTELQAEIEGIPYLLEAISYGIIVANLFDGTSDSSNVVDFTVLGTAPTITSISPASATIGDPDTTITITGTNFRSDSYASAFNSRGWLVTFATTYVSETELRAVIPAASLVSSETYDISITNPDPLETSNTARFTVGGTPPEVILPPIIDAGNLTITKYTVGGLGTFHFISTIPGYASFTLNTNFIGSGGQASSTFTDIPPGGYIISESVPEGWTKTADTCTVIGIRAGQTTTCSVTNTRGVLRGGLDPRTGTGVFDIGTVDVGALDLGTSTLDAGVLDQGLIQGDPSTIQYSTGTGVGTGIDVDFVKIQSEIINLQELLPSITETPASISSNETVKKIIERVRGLETKFLQAFLNAHGYAVSAVGPGSPGNETEFFGNLTKRALCRFQVSKKIVESDSELACGIYGPKTKQVIGIIGK